MTVCFGYSHNSRFVIHCSGKHCCFCFQAKGTSAERQWSVFESKSKNNMIMIAVGDALVL